MDLKQEKHFIVDILFVLALFGVFAFCALALVTVGADVYRHTVNDMNSNYDSRVAVSYLSGKLRQNDTLTSDQSLACIASLEGAPALVLTQAIEGCAYETYLYYHEGFLKELFMRKGASLGGSSLTAGQKIMKLNAFHAEQIADNLISIRLTTADGQKQQLYLSTHCAAH